MQPFNLTSSNTMHSWQSPDYPDGYIFGYMTLGGAVMPSYANDLSPTERWHVVNYVRQVLQKVPADVTAAQSK
jgi:mono/diheme cytochrome c family protein